MKIFVFLLTALFCCCVNATVTVYPIEISVNKGGASKIQVISQSDKVSFVKIVVKKIIEPGTKNEKEVNTGTPDKPGLIVTPLKLAITPGATRIVRLITLEPPPKETTWRVYFEEVSADDYNSPTVHGEKKASVGVNIVWGALVHVLAINPFPRLELDADTGELVNTGSIRIPITELGECTSKDNCIWKKADTTFYPDTRKKINNMIYDRKKSYRIKFKNVVSGKVDETELIDCRIAPSSPAAAS